MAATVLTSVLSCCVQSIFRKSIFTVSGAAQTIAGRPSECLWGHVFSSMRTINVETCHHLLRDGEI
jgi:hypothetical protein